MDINYFDNSGNTVAKSKITKEFLGGKGYGLARMSDLNINVPPGFTIPTTYCEEYYNGSLDVMANVAAYAPTYLDRLYKHFGYMPLVSVRSGAAFSMPGMMETVLNVGLTQSNLEEWMDRIGVRAALDSRRRLIHMLGATAMGIPDFHFEQPLEELKKKYDFESDAELKEEHLALLCDVYLDVYCIATGGTFPETLEEQVQLAVNAVFESWMGPKAVAYRKMNNIPDDIGTAVTVQAMVFGNMNEKSGSGVMFTRDPNTGKNVIMGEFLPVAQGEDVVAGIRTPLDLLIMKSTWPKVYSNLLATATHLETVFNDMQDLEFTVQDGELFILQTRTGKRTAQAAFAIALDFLEEGSITESELMNRITPEQYMTMRRPVIDQKKASPPIAQGLAASVGIAKGAVVFTSEAAKDSPVDCILVRKDTNPDDIEGMNAAVGILTTTGGVTSHAAVVARSMDKPCIAGCSDITINDKDKTMIIEYCGEQAVLKEGEVITIDGSTGDVYFGGVPVVDNSNSLDVRKVDRILRKAYGFIRKAGDVIANDNDGIVCVMAAEKFPSTLIEGSAEMYTQIVDALLSDILEAGPNSVVLDISPPTDFVEKSDLLLWDIMSWDDFKSNSALYTECLLNKLYDADYDLAGMTVQCGSLKNVDEGALASLGLHVVSTPTTLADAITVKAVKVDDHFINNIVGNPTLWNELKENYNILDVPMALSEVEAAYKYLKAG